MRRCEPYAALTWSSPSSPRKLTETAPVEQGCVAAATSRTYWTLRGVRRVAPHAEHGDVVSASRWRKAVSGANPGPARTQRLTRWASPQ
jgi:hypothetical protein